MQRANHLDPTALIGQSSAAQHAGAAHMSKPFNRFDGKTTEADLGVALVWQSGHRPTQQGTSYGIDATYSDPSQLALLRVYR
jgi:hypothetical protein